MGRVSKKIESSSEADFRNKPIVRDCNDTIYKWVLNNLYIDPQEDSSDEQERKQKSQQALETFRANYCKDVTGEKSSATPRLTYRSLPAFLKIADLTYLKMFARIRRESDLCIVVESKSDSDDESDLGDEKKPVPIIYRNSTEEKVLFPSKEAEIFARSCEQLPDKQRSALKEFIWNISSPSVKELARWEGKLTTRVLTSCGLKINTRPSTVKNMLKAPDNSPKITSGNTGSFESIKICDLPFLSEYFGLSLHWLLQLDDNVSVYSDIEDVDTILDYFCFFDLDYQNCLQTAVDQLLKGGLTQ